MEKVEYIRENLTLQHLPVYEGDLPFIQQTFETVNEAKGVLKKFPDLNMEVPITIVDKAMMT